MEPTLQRQPLETGWLRKRMIGRASLWGVASGASLGLVYSTIVNVITEMNNLMTTTASTLAPNSSIPVQVIGVAILGAIFGWILGGIIGFVLGVINGWVLGIVTCIFFYPFTNVVRYRWVVGLASISVSLLGAWRGFTWSFGGAVGQEAIMLITIPTIIAGVTALVASQVLATWYVRIASQVQQGYEIR